MNEDMTLEKISELQKMYPWLAYLEGELEHLNQLLHQKELHYGGSWQKRGGTGAFMMLARKWDRIEHIAKENHYEILEAMELGIGEVEDDVRDLVGYLLLCLAEHRRRKEERAKNEGV